MDTDNTPGAARHRILIVDDSPTQAKLLEQMLAEQGYRVLSARNGSEALAKIGTDSPDLVISDILMPEMDGFELCRRVRELQGKGQLPIILLTHLNDPADVLHSLEVGADYFVSKPYSRKLLLSRIRAVLEGERLCRQGEVDNEVSVGYRGRQYRVHADCAHTLELLLATYEMAAEKNQELLGAQALLSNLNRELEQRVLERTAALTQETAERLQALEELRKKDEVLMQQSRQAAMGEMIGNIAHQWRQPLNAVGLLVQDLTLSYEYGNFSREYLDTSTGKIMQMIRHMSQTIDDFRNFFTPDKEKTEFQLEKVLRRTLALVDGSLNDKGIVIELEAGEVPPVVGHPNEFSQVILNIINNAMDAFCERKVRSPHLKVALSRHEGRAVVTIADNAGGIPDEVIGRIFEPYFTTKEQGKGTGIGLFMAKNIVEKSMNGSLTVRNTAAGAEFRIEV
ncbi:hybrid sensor histidine kinase/response regulator [Geomonas azotofigens]|uniref:hybrid sensor histidine kinase/response regulator n=1 Tax=Geomonas azotofigens TaxID=2843196 RepID=UPI001C11FDB4|nr:response regulator [Geomonas azotofigens]MBU5614078.1 response regulator [Geomonas azotofigens]